MSKVRTKILIEDIEKFMNTKKTIKDTNSLDLFLSRLFFILGVSYSALFSLTFLCHL